MNCTECGVSVRDDADYCTECGAALDSASTGRPGQGRDSGATDQATGQRADQPVSGQQANQPTADRTTDRAPPRDLQPADTGWATSRMVAAGGGVLAAVSLFLPWATSIPGGLSVDGMATDYGFFVLVGAIAAFGGAAVNWGRGWGWLSMLFTGIAGVGVTIFAVVFQDVAVRPATGVQVAIVAGAVVAFASFAGITGSLRGS